MTSISNQLDGPRAPVQLPKTAPVRSLPSEVNHQGQQPARRSAEEVRDAFTKFVGNAFYGQMIKSMRSSVGKPAYFHGGRGEEVFQRQLDQQFAEYMTAASGDKFAGPMFGRQFPHLAARNEPAAGLEQLDALSRR